MNAGKILLVDDEVTLVKAWLRILEKEGLSAVGAHSASEAINYLEKDGVAVVFTDINMPGMSGRELLERIKKGPHDVCVNMVTGAGNIQDAVAAMRLGACDYIQKPFESEEIIALTHRCLRHYRDRQEREGLAKAVTRYEELDRLKSEFVSNVSHEFRTPLFSIRGAFDLLVPPGAPGPTPNSGEARLAEVIRQNLDRMIALVNNILDFAKIEKGMLEPRFEPVDIAALLCGTLEALSPLSQQKNLSVHPPGACSGAEVVGDPRQLTQVFTNLLSNAIKFTHAGGKIGADIAVGPESVEVVIWDCGIGIAPQHQEKVFERFYQVDGSLTRESSGSGIGLAIVKGIVEIHRGKIWVESAPQKGSRFHVVLPRRTPYASA